MEVGAIPICGRTWPSVGSVWALLAERLLDIKASYVYVRNVQSKQELSLLYRFWRAGREATADNKNLLNIHPTCRRPVSSAEPHKLGVAVSTLQS